MKQFFQLLTISFGLLLLLGASGKQNDQKAASAGEPDRIALIDAHQGIIPEAASDSPLPLFSRWIIPGDGSCHLIQQHEFFTATCVRTRLHFCMERFLKYSPGIAEKKGIFIILPAPDGDQSMA